MIEADQIIDVNYIASENKRTFSKCEVENLTQEGYHLQTTKCQDGYSLYILAKPAKVIITVAKDQARYKFDMRYGILKAYQRKRITPKLVAQFLEDVNQGKKKIVIYEQPIYYVIK